MLCAKISPALPAPRISTDFCRRPSAKNIRRKKYLAVSVAGMNTASAANMNTNGISVLLVYRNSAFTRRIESIERRIDFVSSQNVQLRKPYSELNRKNAVIVPVRNARDSKLILAAKNEKHKLYRTTSRTA